MEGHTLSGIHVGTQEQRLAHGSQSEAAKAYLSAENRELLYSSVVREVYKRTSGNVTMGPRPDQDLQAIMLNVLDNRLTLRELNQRAFDQAVIISMNNIASYLGYLRDINDKDQHSRNDVSSILRPTDTRTYKENLSRSFI
jgi:hypothetical protein